MSSKILKNTLLDVMPKCSFRSIVAKACLYFPVGLLITLVIFTIIIHMEYKRVGSLVEKEQVHQLKIVKLLIQQDLQTLKSDLLMLANTESLQQYHKTESIGCESFLVNRFLLFMNENTSYDQVRYLDMEGNERIRINKGDTPLLVSASELQNKKDRYYVKNTLGLNEKEILISPLDLNMENKTIEVPHLPVVRVGTVVLDHSGQKRGMVLLNFMAQPVLNRYQDAFPEQQLADFSIVNRNGFWLKNKFPEKEWGFMFGRKSSLQNERPALWTAIETEGSGQFRVSDGLFTYDTIYPERDIMEYSGVNYNDETHNPILEKQHYFAWHLLLFIPKEKLSYQSFVKQYSHLIWLIPLVVCALVISVIYLATVRVKKLNTDRFLGLLSTAIEQSPAAVVITDVDGKIQYANPKFETMTGYSRNEVQGENPRIFKSGTTPYEVYSHLWQTVLDGEVWTGDFENKRKNETPYYVSAKIAPMFEKNGEIGSLVAIQEDITENKFLQEQLERLATTDGLTDVFNRSHFMNLFELEAQRITRYGKSLSIISFDIDYFKSVNDTYGHHAGDQVLRAFAETISAGLRGSDIFARLGGEEFCALLLETDGPDGQQLADRLRRAVEELSVEVDGKTIQITVSIGATEWTNGDMETEEVLKRADKALYAAKEQGRNRVVFNSATGNTTNKG